MNKQFKISLFIIILTFSTLVSNPKKAEAVPSWPDVIGFTYKQALEVIWEQVQAALLSALKQAAIDTINDTVNNLISGATQTASLFITDWEDYLFSSPQNSASSHMNDFFTITTRGKSSGNYTSTGCSGGSSFSEWRSTGAQETIGVEIDFTDLQADFQEYACDATEMFTEGTWDAYNAFMQPNNNPIAYALIAESEYEKKLNEEIEESKTKAMAYQGFKPQEDSGLVISPGSLLKDITSSANTISDMALASAVTAGEMAGIVVGEIASNAIKQGIGNARQNIQNEINDSICSGYQSLSDELDNLSPDGSLMSDLGIGSLGSSSSTSSSSCTIQ